MDLSEVIGDLIAENGGQCFLDKLHVPYETDAAGPAAKFGLGCELYLKSIDRQVMREQSLQFFLDFYRMFPERVGQFLPTEARRTIKIKGDLESLIRADMSKTEPKKGYGTALFGAVDIGLPKDDVEPYQARLLIGRENRNRLSFALAFMPVCDGQGKNNFEVLCDAVLRWCAIFKPVHGGAGFSFIFSSAMSQNSVYTLQIMKRFPGIEFIDGVAVARETEEEQNRIKGVNWLTVLNYELVEQLGGLEQMKKALEPACTIHNYDGGVLIQAGPTPRIGDAQRGDIPTEYRMVARFTKPIRFENYDERLFRVPDGLDDKAETLEWIRRFD